MQHEGDGAGADLRELLAPAEQGSLLDLTRSLLLCDGAEQFRQAMLACRALLPFEHACASLARVGRSGGIVSHELVNIDFPDEMVRYYAENRLEDEDPWFSELGFGFHPFSWEEVFERHPVGPRLQRILDDLEWRHGYVQAMAAPSRFGVGVSYRLTASEAADRRFVALSGYLHPFVFQGLLRAARPGAPAPAATPLSPSETELLRWVRAGKNNWEIARILRISENTVKFHLKNAMRKLEAANRTHAVAKALERGLLDD